MLALPGSYDVLVTDSNAGLNESSISTSFELLEQNKLTVTWGGISHCSTQSASLLCNYQHMKKALHQNGLISSPYIHPKRPPFWNSPKNIIYTAPSWYFAKTKEDHAFWIFQLVLSQLTEWGEPDLCARVSAPRKRKMQP